MALRLRGRGLEIWRAGERGGEGEVRRGLDGRWSGRLIRFFVDVGEASGEVGGE